MEFTPIATLYVLEDVETEGHYSQVIVSEPEMLQMLKDSPPRTRFEITELKERDIPHIYLFGTPAMMEVG